MNKKAFIFDLDGVLVDTAKYHFFAWKKLANSLGIDFSVEQNEQLKGVSRAGTFEKILEWGNITLPEDEFTRLLAQKNEDYLSYINQLDGSHVLPGAKEMVEYLLENNYPIALGSASRNSRRILERANLLSHFEVIVDGTYDLKGKPNPAIFLTGAAELGVAPENCIVFEDSVAGVTAANTANMLSIGIGEEHVLSHAKHVFADLSQVSIDFVKEIGVIH
jgi:beta-phosphoglucomutase